MRVESNVTPPSSRKIGIAVNAQPFPIEEVIAATMLRSSKRLHCMLNFFV